VNRINVHNTYIHNVNTFHSNGNFNYAYAHNTHAVTAASRSAFTGGQAINRGAAHIDEASLRSAQVTNKAGFSPTRQSALGAANARGNVSRPPSSVENRSVMARTTPAAGASHTPVHPINTNGLSAGRPPNAGTTARQNQLSQSRPPSAGNNNDMRMQNSIPGNNGNKAGTNSSRSWSAQGNTTDRGQAPNGFGSSNNRNASNNSTMSARANNRPPWAGSGAQANGANAGGRSYTPQGSASSNTRSYAPQGARGGNPAPTRTYSAPSRSYGGGSAPHSSGGGSAPHSGGGGGGSHGGGGGGSHGHR
jgi:hypothetical protein